MDRNTMIYKRPACNISLAKKRVKCFYETFVQGSSFVILLNICAKKPLLRQAEKRCVQHIFRTYAENFSLIFPKEIYWNCYRKILREKRKPNQTLSINFVLKLRFRENSLWNQNLKLSVAWKFTLRENPNFVDKRCV